MEGEAGAGEAEPAVRTLWAVLSLLVRLMAPFTPFLTELMWKHLGARSPEESVHYTNLPLPNASLIDAVVERRVAAMRTVVELGRIIRERNAIPIKARPQPSPPFPHSSPTGHYCSTR